MNKQEKFQLLTYNGIKDGYHNINVIIISTPTSYGGFFTTMFFETLVSSLPLLSMLLRSFQKLMFCCSPIAKYFEVSLLTSSHFHNAIGKKFHHFHFFPKRSCRLLKSFDLKQHFISYYWSSIWHLENFTLWWWSSSPPPPTYYFCYSQHLMSEPQCFHKTKECYCGYVWKNNNEKG